MINKYSLLLAPLLMVSGGSAMADSGPGCGLGQQLFAGKTGLGPHVLAAFTNASVSYNQLFGLSFDSLGCDGETIVTAEFQRNVFVVTNYDSIARDAAQGGGDHLQSLASLMQMQDDDAQRFYTLAQNNYDQLFGETHGDHDKLLQKLDSALLADPLLSKYSFISDS